MRLVIDRGLPDLSAQYLAATLSKACLQAFCTSFVSELTLGTSRSIPAVSNRRSLNGDSLTIGVSSVHELMLGAGRSSLDGGSLASRRRTSCVLL